ncbi:hypothetical protein R1sor_004940 [Riccia sorocarpa]|uniref:Uncharacterized protein n=1 Tax=Riccia sorocarpa TaxID=122646 RepID=A0ABD3HLM6_9MARC
MLHTNNIFWVASWNVNALSDPDRLQVVRGWLKNNPEVQEAEVKEDIKLLWRAHPSNVTDPRVKWELAWNRGKKLLQPIVKDLELKEARSWRLIKEQSGWVRKGDTPSHYFFAMLKSKFKQEKLESLTTESGEVQTSKEEILTETYLFYQNLFSEDSEFGEAVRRNTLREGLGLLRRKVEPGQSSKLKEIPSIDEIERIVEMLPPLPPRNHRD